VIESARPQLAFLVFRKGMILNSSTGVGLILYAERIERAVQSPGELTIRSFEAPLPFAQANIKRKRYSPGGR
jgi:hypothetical protein